MIFLSDIYKLSFGEISTKTFTEINIPYEFYNDYLYARGTNSTSELTNYFSYMSETTFNVDVSALSVELYNDAKYGFYSVDCSFVDEGEDAFSSVKVIENVIDARNQYCIRGKNNSNGKIYTEKYKKN